MNNKKSYYKGLMTGIAICVLLIGVLTLSGCFLGAYMPSVVKSDSKTKEKDETEVLSDRYDEIEQKLDTLQQVVDQYYLSDEEVSTDEMVEGIYKLSLIHISEPTSPY